MMKKHVPPKKKLAKLLRPLGFPTTNAVRSKGI
jgi:hypothetical protein